MFVLFNTFVDTAGLKWAQLLIRYDEFHVPLGLELNVLHSLPSNQTFYGAVYIQCIYKCKTWIDIKAVNISWCAFNEIYGMMNCY